MHTQIVMYMKEAICDRRDYLEFCQVPIVSQEPLLTVLVVEHITWYQNGTILTDPCIKLPCSTDLKNLETWHYRRIKKSVRCQEEGITRIIGCFGTDTLCAQYVASCCGLTPAVN